jgi:glutaredoxin-related protein
LIFNLGIFQHYRTVDLLILPDPMPAEGGDLIQIVLLELTGQPTVPYVFIKGDFVGGADG